MNRFVLKRITWRFGVVNGLAWRYARVAIPFVVAAAAALGNAGCSDGPDGNSGGGGAGGEASTSSSSSSSGSGGGASSSSSSSSSGMMGCGDLQTDPMNCGMCGNQCALGQTCAAGVCTCANTSVAFADVQAILTNRCATMGCHSGGGIAKAGLDLTAGVSYAALVGKSTTQCNGSRMRVIPNKPEESYLVDKVMGIDLCGASKRMPPSISLSAADIQTISDWICAGALEN